MFHFYTPWNHQKTSGCGSASIVCKWDNRTFLFCNEFHTSQMKVDFVQQNFQTANGIFALLVLTFQLFWSSWNCDNFVTIKALVGVKLYVINVSFKNCELAYKEFYKERTYHLLTAALNMRSFLIRSTKNEVLPSTKNEEGSNLQFLKERLIT